MKLSNEHLNLLADATASPQGRIRTPFNAGADDKMSGLVKAGLVKPMQNEGETHRYGVKLENVYKLTAKGKQVGQEQYAKQYGEKVQVVETKPKIETPLDKGHARALEHTKKGGVVTPTRFDGGSGWGRGGSGYWADNGKTQLGILKNGNIVRNIESSGKGRGNWGHEGRPGQRGGSA